MLTGARHEEACAPLSDMHGKTVVVTGGNSGIGFETAAELASMGARVLVTARNADKGRAARRRPQPAGGGDGLASSSSSSTWRDLASGSPWQRPRSSSRRRALDVLVNNAGLVLSERAETVDGYEATFAINHLRPLPA